jgi:hypothetical protein
VSGGFAKRDEPGAPKQLRLELAISAKVTAGRMVNCGLWPCKIEPRTEQGAPPGRFPEIIGWQKVVKPSLTKPSRNRNQLKPSRGDTAANLAGAGAAWVARYYTTSAS